MAGFGDSIAAMDAAVEDTLSDGLAEFIAANGRLQHPALLIMLDKDAERIDTVQGLIARAVTISVRRSALLEYDRQGAFRLDAVHWGADGKTWHLDGIASDDGHWITFYVVP